METLKQGDNFIAPTGEIQGIVNYDVNTGKKLNAGETTTYKPPEQNSITLDSLAPVPELKLPEVTPETESQKLIDSITTESEIARKQRSDKSEKNDATSDISKILSDIGAVEGKEDLYATQAGADKASEEADYFQSLIETESRALKNIVDSTYRNPNLTQTLASRVVTEEQRKSASLIADYSIAQNIAARRYDRAIGIAERKVEAELAPLKHELDAKKFVYDSNIDLWNASEKSILSNMIKKEERFYDEQKEEKEGIEAIKIQVAKNGMKDLSVFKDVKTISEAIVAGSKYMSDPLDRALKQASLNKTNQEINKIAAEIKASGQLLQNNTVAGSSNDLAKKMLNSAVNKSDLSQSEREKLAKMGLVIEQLDTLQSSISSSNKTGLFKGRAGTLLANLGADADVGYINAQLTALVPNVARGIYGEVGVLTKDDVELYKKTLPNAKTIAEQNDLVLAMTLKNAVASYELALKSAVNSNINVSGWTQDYLAIKNQVSTIEDRAGVTKVKVDDLYVKNLELQPIISELYTAGATDREVLQALGIN